MRNYITKESMELILESIVDAVESAEDRDLQFEMVEQILISEGLCDVLEEE